MACNKNNCELTAEVIDALKSAIGEANVKCAENGVVVTVSSTEEVAAVTKIAKNAKVVAATCGNTPITVAFSEKMQKVEVVSEDYAIKAKAGATYRMVMNAAAQEGLIVGCRPFHTLKVTVGEWLGSNEAGYGTYKYGAPKDNVLNLEIVLRDGTVIETGYDNIGAYMSAYNLNQLFSGAEGSLGIITAATIKAYPAGVSKYVAYELPGTFKDACPIFQDIARHPNLKPYLYTAQVEATRTCIFFEYQGAENFVDQDIIETDAIMEAHGAVRSDAKKQGNAENKYKAIIPLRKIYKADAKFAAILDKYTALVSTNTCDGIKKIIADCGGRKACGWTFAEGNIERIHDEPTAKFMKNLMKFMVDPDVAPILKNEEKLSRAFNDEILAKLVDSVGKDNVNTTGEEKLLYCHDLAPLPKMAGIAFDNIPDVVVRPSTTAQLSAIMKIAYKHGIAVTPRGNSTWGLGGSQPTCGGIVVDCSSKMNKITVDEDKMIVKVQSGATWKATLDACMKKGYIVGSYPSSFPAGTIGAWLATNGMGIGSYKYGSAKDNVLNMEVVLPNGDVVVTGYDDMGNYNSGLNLNQFFEGAEGTLGMFGVVTFRIHPMGVIKPVAYEFEHLVDANPAIQKIIAHASVVPLHIAWSDENHFANQKKAGCHAPDVKNLLCVTFQGAQNYVDMEIAEVDAIAAEFGGKRIADEIAAHEWDERCYEFRARKAGVGEIPAEVIVPAKCWGDFVKESYKGFTTMKMDLGGVIGVMVDKQTTLFMPYYFKDDELMTGMLAFSFNFYLGDRAAEYGGRTTGFGVFFAWNLDNIHDANTVALMRQLKTFVDPHDVMNPGHVVCGMTRFGINMSHGLMSIGSKVMQVAKKIMPADHTFDNNIKRFKFNEYTEIKCEDRKHVLGRGYE
ncbi:MAG: FAD-binding oxidoreductase [archaeon]|nr:FAD-binding oxidoreductase [archaeon]